MKVERELLAGAMDYAGLFPPAALPLATAVANYQGYLAGDESWALGRFLIPAQRLGELTAFPETAGWRLGAVGGPDLAADLDTIRDGAEAGRPVEVLETRAAPESALEAGLPVYGEVAPGAGLESGLDALQRAGWRAKVRTGGVLPGSVPEADELLAFLRGCQIRDLSWKATAGLHHPLTGVYPVDDSPNGAPTRMYGFLNLLAATAAILAGDAGAARRALEATTVAALALPADAVAVRRRLHGWGSCSFEIPMRALRALRTAR